MTDIIPAGQFDLEHIEKMWSDAGLTPMEVTEQDFYQDIHIRHNAASGALEISYKKLDGVQVLGLMGMIMRAVWRDTFQAEIRPRLSSGNSKVCIQLEGEKLSIAFGTSDPNRPDADPTADPVVAVGLAACAVFAISARVSGPEFDPMKALLQGLEFQLEKLEKE